MRKVMINKRIFKELDNLKKWIFYMVWKEWLYLYWYNWKPQLKKQIDYLEKIGYIKDFAWTFSFMKDHLFRFSRDDWNNYFYIKPFNNPLLIWLLWVNSFWVLMKEFWIKFKSTRDNSKEITTIWPIYKRNYNDEHCFWWVFFHESFFARTLYALYRLKELDIKESDLMMKNFWILFVYSIFETEEIEKNFNKSVLAIIMKNIFFNYWSWYLSFLTLFKLKEELKDYILWKYSKEELKEIRSLINTFKKQYNDIDEKKDLTQETYWWYTNFTLYKNDYYNQLTKEEIKDKILPNLPSVNFHSFTQMNLLSLFWNSEFSKWEFKVKFLSTEFIEKNKLNFCSMKDFIDVIIEILDEKREEFVIKFVHWFYNYLNELTYDKHQLREKEQLIYKQMRSLVMFSSKYNRFVVKWYWKMPDNIRIIESEIWRFDELVEKYMTLIAEWYERCIKEIYAWEDWKMKNLWKILENAIYDNFWESLLFILNSWEWTSSHKNFNELNSCVNNIDDVKKWYMNMNFFDIFNYSLWDVLILNNSEKICDPFIELKYYKWLFKFLLTSKTDFTKRVSSIIYYKYHKEINWVRKEKYFLSNISNMEEKLKFQFNNFIWEYDKLVRIDKLFDWILLFEKSIDEYKSWIDLYMKKIDEQLLELNKNKEKFEKNQKYYWNEDWKAESYY